MMEARIDPLRPIGGRHDPIRPTVPVDARDRADARGPGAGRVLVAAFERRRFHLAVRLRGHLLRCGEGGRRGPLPELPGRAAACRDTAALPRPEPAGGAPAAEHARREKLGAAPTGNDRRIIRRHRPRRDPGGPLALDALPAGTNGQGLADCRDRPAGRKAARLPLRRTDRRRPHRVPAEGGTLTGQPDQRSPCYGPGNRFHWGRKKAKRKIKKITIPMIAMTIWKLTHRFAASPSELSPLGWLYGAG